jgi:hypothetical protein
MDVEQQVLTYLMRVIDLNINTVDEFEALFQFRSWNSLNTMKFFNQQKQVVSQSAGTSVTSREVTLKFAAL